MVMGAPEAALPGGTGDPVPTCGQLEAEGKNGGIELDLCPILAEQVFDICECGPASEAGPTDRAVPVESPSAPVAQM